MANYQYDELSEEIRLQNYQAPGETTRLDLWKRMAHSNSQTEKKEVIEKIESEFFSILYDDRFIPGGRIMANLGVPGREQTTMYNCFVHHPKDIGLKNCDSIHGIYSLLSAQAKTLKSEGGYGINASFIRPAGSYIRGIGSRTPGVLKFMELWDKSSEIITEGSVKIVGKRRKEEKNKIRKGAQMLVLNVWHPEIEDFITAKLTPNRLTKFNLSVGITKGFMEKVISDEMWDLKYPDTEFKKYNDEWFGDIDDWENKGYPVIIHKTVNAKELWESIMKSTYNRNDPGVLFLDIANRMNPIYYAETIFTTNPCMPGWSKLLTKDGIKEMKDVEIGDMIWSKEGWTTIINKWSTGVKKVFKYKTSSGIFYGTENHKVVSNGEKIEAKDAETIDIIRGIYKNDYEIDPQDIMDGLVIGDGTVHKASNDLVYLLVGEDDNDYFQSEIKNLILKHRPGLTIEGYEISTTIKSEELPKTFDRRVPERFLKNKNKLVGFLRGLYSANGSVCGNRITLKSSSSNIVEDVQMMLNSIGIKSYITTNKPSKVKFSNGEYLCKKSYDLNITSDRMKFKNLIGFIQKYKNEKIIELPESNKPEKISYEIQEISFVSEEEVFDITVNNKTHTFWTQGCDVSNCGEIPMSTGVCNLGSLNLVMFVKKDESGKVYFDFDAYRDAIIPAVRFLDNINDISTTPLPEYKEEVLKKRRIGLGNMAWGSMHFMLGIRFGSKKSLELIEKISKLKAETELLASAELGAEKGSFLLFDKEKYFNSLWWKTLEISDEVKKKIEKIGCMRNSHISMNAPTGNTGIYAKNVSGGIEPVFAREYARWSIVPEFDRAKLIELGLQFPNVGKSEWFETTHFKFAQRNSEQILRGSFNGKNYEIDKNRGLIIQNLVEDYGWKFAKEYYKDNLQQMKDEGLFATAMELSVDDHINTLIRISHFTNQANSKTVNVPNDYPYEDFENLYMTAWKNNIKGITTYREGTATVVLEEIGNKKTEEYKNVFNENHAPKRPEKLECDVHQATIKGEQWTIFIGKLEDKPYEIFGGLSKYVHIPKKVKTATIFKKGKSNGKGVYDLTYGEGDDETRIHDIVSVFENATHSTLSRTLSLSLRHGTPIQYVVEQLGKDDKDSDMYSFSRVIARVMKHYIKEGTKASDKKCPSCDTEDSIVYIEGCKTCQNCGFSKC